MFAQKWWQDWKKWQLEFYNAKKHKRKLQTFPKPTMGCISSCVMGFCSTWLVWKRNYVDFFCDSFFYVQLVCRWSYSEATCVKVFWLGDFNHKAHRDKWKYVPNVRVCINCAVVKWLALSKGLHLVTNVYVVHFLCFVGYLAFGVQIQLLFLASKIHDKDLMCHG